MYKVIVTPGNNSGLVRKVLLMRGNWEVADDGENLENQLPRSHFIWSPVSLPLRYYQIADEGSRSQNRPIVMNHFENHRVITTKVNLIRTLRNYYMHEQSAYRSNYTVFSTTPTTFILSVGNEDKEYYEFVHRYGELEKQHFTREKVPAKHCKENLWLVKPANLNQGRGIEIFRKLSQITQFLGSKPLNSLWVVQKYIEKPLLYHGRKFDIRVWVLVTGRNQVYFYRKGYIRTSSDEYSLDKNNNYVHLTNNCLQKFGSGYSKFEEGNTLPLEVLHDYVNGLECYTGLGFDLQRDIVQRIKDVIIDTVVAGKKAFLGRKREFQLFGYDFLVDEDLRTWLIEVNTNPYLGVPNDYIKDLLNRMLDDMLKLVVDPVFPPKNKDIFSDTNDFELIYSEDPFRSIRSPFNKAVYPIESLAQAPNRKKNDESQPESEKKLFKEYSADDHIRQLLETHCHGYGDGEPLLKPVGRLLSEIMNWQLDSEENRSNHTKTLKLLQESKFVQVLAHQKFIPLLTKVVDSQSFPTEIQTVVIECIMTMCRSVETKIRVATPDMIAALVKVGLSMFDQKEYKQFHKNLIKACIKSLMALAGVHSVKYFIPGETRENKAIRDNFIKYGGLSVILLAESEPDYRDQIKQFLSNVSLSDWEMQLQALNQQSPKLSKESPNQEHSTISVYNAKLVEQVEAYINEEKNKAVKRERQLRQRRERYEQEQQRIRQEKQRSDRQKKLATEEYIRRKNNERLKIKQEEERKITELRMYEEERKRRLAEEIQKRREEIKVVRNDSNLKLQREKEREKERQKEREQLQRREKYTSEERQRILSDWLESKREQSRLKKLQLREMELQKSKLDEQRKQEIQERVTKIQMRAKDREKKEDKDMEKLGELKDVLPIHVANESELRIKRPLKNASHHEERLHTKSKSRFPKVPKTPRRIHPRSVNQSDDESDPKHENKYASNQKRLILKDDNNQAVKCFMNVVRRAIRTKRKQVFSGNGHISIDNHGSSEIIDKKMTEIKDMREQQPTQFVRTEQMDDKKDRARAVIDFILSSPYSSFVRKNNKFKHVVEEVERLAI